MRVRSFGMSAVLLVGCAVGGVSGQLVVPKASAQQAATLTRWEVVCHHQNEGSFEQVAASVTKDGNALGQEGWELSTASGQVYCWKRPKP